MQNDFYFVTWIFFYGVCFDCIVNPANEKYSCCLRFHAQFLPLKFFFENMRMHDMLLLLCIAFVLCCVGWLVWRLQGFLRHMYNHPACEVREAWHNIAQASAAFRNSGGVASDFDNWVQFDSRASVTIINEAFLNKCCTVIRRVSLTALFQLALQLLSLFVLMRRSPDFA